MTHYVSKSEMERMENTILDEETHMTEADYMEWRFPYDEWVVVED